MSYPNFGCVKTIVLPIPENRLTLDEYQKMYGIDLKEFLALKDNGAIYLSNEKLKNSLILIGDFQNLGSGETKLNPIIKCLRQNYVHGSTDGYLLLGALYSNDDDDYEGIKILIDKDKPEFSIDNVEVAPHIF